MKTITLTVVALALTSCEGNNNSLKSKDTDATYGLYETNIEQITFEGCQYIGKFGGYNTDWGTHKGNCNNPIHSK